uniref:Uncharacterized protein n=1 Tax=Oncorhynchus mykiss TaxID=8022 RepID=A0A8K9UPF0_ONCMY
MSGAHLGEWQRRSFDISSGTCTPEQTADAYRVHILAIQYAWSSAQPMLWWHKLQNGNQLDCYC